MRSKRAQVLFAPYFLILFVVASGCTPRLAPKYGDYRINSDYLTRSDTEEDPASKSSTSTMDADSTVLRTPEESDKAVLDRIATAIEASGWTLVEPDVENAIATDKRKFNNWLFYSVEAELEVVVIGRKYIRVFIHPYRHYFWGGRGKIPYLKSGLARAVIESLNDAFEEQGFEFIGNGPMRDAAYRKRDD